jgi:hypothetical protein
MPLTTYAEKQAEAARKIEGFKDFALDGVRDKVATILGMIGRVDGVFSTYTLCTRYFSTSNLRPICLTQPKWLISECRL